jgi:hypothetical protein
VKRYLAPQASPPFVWQVQALQSRSLQTIKRQKTQQPVTMWLSHWLAATLASRLREVNLRQSDRSRLLAKLRGAQAAAGSGRLSDHAQVPLSGKHLSGRPTSPIAGWVVEGGASALKDRTDGGLNNADYLLRKGKP